MIAILPTITSSQSTIHVSGIVKSEDGEILYKALVRHETSSSISNSLGYYHLSIPKTDSFRLEVSYLGYQTVDTLIASPFNDSITINFRLKSTSLSLPEINISPQTQTLFDRSNWVILDYLIVPEKILLLVIENNKRWLYSYTISGEFISRLAIGKQYNQIHQSCLGSVYILNKQFFIQVDFSSYQIKLSRRDTRSKFDQFIAPCLFKVDDQLIFKSWQQHHQRADYFFYQKQHPTLLYSTYDRKAEQVAASQYNKVINMYLQTRSTSSKETIDHGFQKENIITNGSWNGDLTDLIITNNIHQEVGFYEAVLARPVKTWDAILEGNKFIIVDFVEQKALLFSKVSAKGFKLVPVDPLIWEDAKSMLLSDSRNEQLYFLDSKNQLYQLNYKKGILTASFTQRITSPSSYVGQYIIFGRYLYFISYPSRQSPKNRLYKIEINIK
jgi:hypothetical protein